MANEVSKPDFSFQWASGGAIVAPSDVKIQTGWTAEVPPFQWENFAQNRQDNAILHLFQKGISEWDAASNYYFTTSGVRSYVQGSDGNIYVALQDSVGQDPTTATAYWGLAFVTPISLNGGRMLRVTTSGSFTVPANVTTLIISGCAGGGGGGACVGGSSQTSGGGAGGGAGQSIQRQSYTVTPGQVIPYTIGAGGTGGVNFSTPATSGGNTLVGTGGSILTLTGGTLGINGANIAGANPGVIGGAGFPNGGDATDITPGSSGGSGGQGGSGPFGGVPGISRGASATTIAGKASSGFGVGGSGAGGYYIAGAGSIAAGAAGMPGLLIFEW